MRFTEFKEFIQNNILDGWMQDAELEVEEVFKNNGIQSTALYIKEPMAQASPSIYLEQYYTLYRSGMSLQGILDKIRTDYEIAKEHMPDLSMTHFHFDSVRDQIVYRLVNYEKNKEILKNCPFIQVGDLAVTFRWVAHYDEEGISSSLISDKELRFWEVTMDDLLVAAKENTPRIFPPFIARIEDMMRMMTGEDIAVGEEIPMYILTNDREINGATSLLYEDVLHDFSSAVGCDVYVLPSSIHELILMPVDAVADVDLLKTIVKEANSTVVEEGDLLSDSVYLYEAKEDRLRIV